MYRRCFGLNWFRYKRTYFRKGDDTSAPNMCGPVSDVRWVRIKAHFRFGTTVFETSISRRRLGDISDILASRQQGDTHPLLQGFGR